MVAHDTSLGSCARTCEAACQAEANRLTPGLDILFFRPDGVDPDQGFDFHRGGRGTEGQGIHFSAELSFQFFKLGVNLLLLLLAADHIFAVALQEVVDGFNADF